MADEKKQSALARFLLRGGLGATIGYGMGGAKGALMGGLMGGGSTAIGDAALGAPKNSESGFGGEAKRGAIGGAAMGGGLGLLAMGMDKKGMALVKNLMQKGMSKNKAMALLLGAGAVGGGGAGAALQGLEQGVVLGFDDDKLLGMGK